MRCQYLGCNQNQPHTQDNGGGGGDTGGWEFRIGKPGGAGEAPLSDWEQESMRLNYNYYVSVNEGGQDVQYAWRWHRLA